MRPSVSIIVEREYIRLMALINKAKIEEDPLVRASALHEAITLLKEICEILTYGKVDPQKHNKKRL